MRDWPLSTDPAKPVWLHVVGDEARDLAISPEQLKALRKTVALTTGMFGAVPYRRYDSPGFGEQSAAERRRYGASGVQRDLFTRRLLPEAGPIQSDGFSIPARIYPRVEWPLSSAGRTRGF
jgi:hypothetical protein